MKESFEELSPDQLMVIVSRRITSISYLRGKLKPRSKRILPNTSLLVQIEESKNGYSLLFVDEYCIIKNKDWKISKAFYPRYYKACREHQKALEIWRQDTTKAKPKFDYTPLNPEDFLD